jgi:hypothetical protein
MAVHFALRVGNRSIGHLEARRDAYCQCTHPEHSHRYKVTITRHATGAAPASTTVTHVTHEYGQGAWALIAAALAATSKENRL